MGVGGGFWDLLYPMPTGKTPFSTRRHRSLVLGRSARDHYQDLRSQAHSAFRAPLLPYNQPLLQVISAKRAADALCIVRETENELDLILTETYLPDMERYEFLEALGQMSNLPIVVMSAEKDSKAILGSYHKGAVFYLVKPFMMNDVKNLWQFAYISKTERMMSMEELSGFTGELRYGDYEAQESVETMEKQALLCGKRNEQEDVDNGGKEDNLQVLKELRITWTNDLHEKFLQAVKVLGIQNARPKSILERMNVQGLTRDKISSHLQKYRLALRKEQESAQNTTRKSSAESMNTAHQPEFQSYFQENLNSPMDMPSLGSIYPTNHVDRDPNGVPNFIHAQSTLPNSFPDFSGLHSTRFAFEDFDIGGVSSLQQYEKSCQQYEKSCF